MPDQYAVAQAQRAALLRGDRAVSRVVLDAYFKAWQSINERLGVLTTQLQEARAAGLEPGAGWLYEQDRLLSLQRQVAGEVSSVASRLAPFLTGEQARWVEQSQRDTAALVQAGTTAVPTTGSALPLLHPAAIETVIGFVSDGSPLRALLDELGPDAAKRVGDALIQGVALGQNPRQIAKSVRTAFSGNMARALLVSRDAVIRSYQEAAHQTYAANADILSGWRWLAAHSPRTCPSCLVMSGTFHPLSERLRSHPGCRCTPIPEVRDGPAPFGQTGAAWFRAQPAEVQRTVVGPKKYDALQKGRIALEDLTILRRSRRWGTHRGEATYTEAVRQANRRKP